MTIATVYSNFARGKIDHDMQGRVDLPVYQTGVDECTNFITNFKGNAIYRTGFENIFDFQDCAFLEFKFSNSQNYICVLYNLKMRFLSYDSSGVFGWVLDGGASILEIDTPYSLAESKELSFKKSTTQNFDSMIIVHENHEPRKLVRESANSFTLSVFARQSDPFILTLDPSKNITAITQASNAQVTISAHSYVVGDRFRIQNVVGMTEVNNWTVAVVSVVDVNNVTIDIDSTLFTAYTSGGIARKVTSGDYPSTALYYRGRLYYAATPLKLTTVWGSESANFDVFTLPTTVTDVSAMVFTLAEIAQKIEWLFAGDNSLIAGAGDGIAAINGGGVGVAITSDTVEAHITSADGSSALEPLRKDGLIFYAGLTGRNLFFFAYDLLTESFISKDANILAYDLTAGILKKSRFLKDRNNIIYSLTGAGEILTTNFNADENIIGWHKQEASGLFKDIASITDNDGNPQLFTLTLRNSVYYIERLVKHVEFTERSKFYTGDEVADDEAYARFISEQLKQAIYLDNSSTLTNLQDNIITYDSGAGTITATSPVFASSDVDKHIVYKTSTGYESGRFLITGYTSATVVSVSVLQAPTINTYSSWYLTFKSVSGLSRFNGLEVGVVTDGGFLQNATISGGTLTLPSQATCAVIGYTYRGSIKSFSLGFQFQGKNTQTTMKSISRVGIRTNASAGGKFGTSPYRLEEVQELSQNDLNYLPPLPIDGTKYLTYVDDNTLDKYFYIVQDQPLPLHVTNLMIDANYTIL